MCRTEDWQNPLLTTERMAANRIRYHRDPSSFGIMWWYLTQTDSSQRPQRNVIPLGCHRRNSDPTSVNQLTAKIRKNVSTPVTISETLFSPRFSLMVSTFWSGKEEQFSVRYDNVQDGRRNRRINPWRPSCWTEKTSERMNQDLLRRTQRHCGSFRNTLHDAMRTWNSSTPPKTRLLVFTSACFVSQHFITYTTKSTDRSLGIGGDISITKRSQIEGHVGSFLSRQDFNDLIEDGGQCFRRTPTYGKEERKEEDDAVSESLSVLIWYPGFDVEFYANLTVLTCLTSLKRTAYERPRQCF